MRIIKLIVGDCSGDGHMMTESFACELNRSDINPRLHYKDAAAKLGVDITKCCDDCEEASITKGTCKKLEAIGCTFEYKAPKDKRVLLSPEDYVHCYVNIFNSLDPKVQLNLLETEDMGIGGYGLFSL